VKYLAAAHVSGELCWEGGRLGVAVETSLVNGPNTFIEGCVARFPVPAAQPVGTKLYTAVARPADPGGATVQAPPSRTTNVATTLTTTATSNIFVGTMIEASQAWGASTAARIRLTSEPVS
jgi:hypothetical protein